MARLLRFLTALFVYRDVHYARRLLGRARDNLGLVLGGLGARYVRVVPWVDFGGAAPDAATERLDHTRHSQGLMRIHLAAYHLVLPEVAGLVVVDVGANEGYGAALLARSAARVIGLDASEEAIAAARCRYPRANVEFFVHDATKPFPVPDHSVDMVFSSETIEHLSDGRAFFRAAARALKPGGRLIVKTPNDDYNRLENRLNPHHTNPYTAARLRAELAERFHDVVLEGYFLDEAIVTSTEDRPLPAPVEELPYRFGDPIEVDRVKVVKWVVTPRRVSDIAREVPEYLLARARRGPVA